MNILKHIQILVLTLVPAFLFSMEQPSSAWIQEAQSARQYGVWTTQDKTGKAVIVEGEMISRKGKIISSEANLKELASLYADVMQGPDMALAQSYALVWCWFKLQTIYHWESYRDLLYESYIKEIDEFISQEKNNCFYIFTISEPQSNGTTMLLGSVMFGIKKDYEHGNAELFHFVIKPGAQGRGLGKILACSILKLLPQIKRIFLDVVCSNVKAQAAYESFGFTQCGKAHYALFYEYLINRCSKLQDIAATFNNI